MRGLPRNNNNKIKWVHYKVISLASACANGGMCKILSNFGNLTNSYQIWKYAIGYNVPIACGVVMNISIQILHKQAR